MVRALIEFNIYPDPYFCCERLPESMKIEEIPAEKRCENLRTSNGSCSLFNRDKYLFFGSMMRFEKHPECKKYLNQKLPEDIQGPQDLKTKNGVIHL